jgi:hypothetical protein
LKLVQIIPRGGFRLYGAIVKKEIQLYKNNKGTFYRSGAKTKNAAKWLHKSYGGWIWIERGLGEVVIAELRSKTANKEEWQLFHAFLGFLDRHFAGKIAAINVQYF